MALGYGSEFHLLRWMGRHRNEFDIRIKQLLGVDNASWIDFDFERGKTIPDKELKGISFLKNEPAYDSILTAWQDEWPQTGNSMNWDLIGYTDENKEKTWLLIEAKAHIDELKQSSGASKDSLVKIKEALNRAANYYGIDVSIKNPWTKKYYQLANRIYILNLLERMGFKAKLINIYFIGDMSSKDRRSPQSEKEWLPEIEKMKKYLGIQNASSIGIVDLFLDVAY